MPAKSKSQRRLFAMALEYKLGKFKGEVSDQIKELSKLPERDLRDYAETKEEGLPESLSEDATLNNVNGMGETSLPGPNGETGSGDIAHLLGATVTKENKKTMKYFKTFEDFIIESSKQDESVELNEMIKADFKKLETFLKDIKDKITDAELYKRVSGFVHAQEIDPYASYKETMDMLKSFWPELLKDKDVKLAMESFIAENNNIAELMRVNEAKGDELGMMIAKDDKDAALKILDDNNISVKVSSPPQYGGDYEFTFKTGKDAEKAEKLFVILEKSDSLADKFEEFAKALEKAKVPCKMKLMKDNIVVECGWNYPDKLADKIWDAGEKLGIEYNQIEVCAEQSGGTVLDTKRINGGPKRY